MLRNDENDRIFTSRAIVLGATLLLYSEDIGEYWAWNNDLTKYAVLYDYKEAAWESSNWSNEYKTREDKYNQLIKMNPLVWQVNVAHVRLEKFENAYVFNPLVSQVAGGHYKDRAIQPVEYIMANNLNFNKGNVVKYITRYEDKGGINDLAKVVHYTLLEAYSQYGEEGSTELALKIKEILNID